MHQEDRVGCHHDWAWSHTTSHAKLEAHAFHAASWSTSIDLEWDYLQSTQSVQSLHGQWSLLTSCYDLTSLLPF